MGTIPAFDDDAGEVPLKPMPPVLGEIVAETQADPGRTFEARIALLELLKTNPDIVELFER